MANDEIPRDETRNANDVVAAVARECGLAPALLTGTSRRRDVVNARQIAMYLLSEDLWLAAEDIGAVLGGRPATTVGHAIDKMRSVEAHSEHIRNLIERSRERLAT